MGVDASAKYGDCTSAQGAEVYSIGDWSIRKGTLETTMEVVSVCLRVHLNIYSIIILNDYVSFFLLFFGYTYSRKPVYISSKFYNKLGAIGDSGFNS